MNVQRIMFVVLSFFTTAAALVAAYYWFISSRPSPEATEEITASISDNEALHILQTRVRVDNLCSILAEASQLNKKASVWSGIAAALGGITAVISMF